MSTTVLDRSSPAAPADTGGVPARRAVARWAWRLFRREWRKELLILALIIVAVGGTIFGAAVATNTPPPARAGFGTADHLVTLSATDPRLAADLAAVRAHFDPVDVIENQNLVTGLVRGAQLRAQDPNGPYGRPMLALVSGRYPAGAGEVAMTKQLAATFAVHIGGLWRNAGRSRRVVGLVDNPQNLLDNFALVAPGNLGAPAQVTVLLDEATAQSSRSALPSRIHPVAPGVPNGISPAVVVFAISIVGLIFTGLIAVAGFTVLAQRRLRGLGMLSALGATDRNVRLVMVVNGTVVGVVGAVIGSILGLAAWIAYAPHLAMSAHHTIAWTHLPWWLVATVVALAVATSTLASRRPARAVARTPVVAALSGRPAPVGGVQRSALPGAGLLAGGLLLLAFSGGWGSNGGKKTLFQLGGLVACAVGLLLLAPVSLAVVGLATPHVPVALRIALRDLVRYRARSSSALAATGFAVFIAMLITLIATGRFADPVDYFGPNLPANQVLLYAPDNGAIGNDPLGTKPGQVSAGSSTSARLNSLAADVAATLDSHDVLPLEATDAFVGQARGSSIRGGPGTVYVATPTLLARYGIAATVVHRTTLLLTSRPGLQQASGLRLIYGDPAGPSPDAGIEALSHPKIQTFSRLPADTAAPNLLVTARAVRQLKLHVSAGGWLITAPTSLTALQINSVRELAAAAGTTIEVKSDAPSLAQLRNYATAAGILLALGVLSMTVGLIRSETGGELRTLTATGASSRTRRTITAATAGTLGLVGAVLGTGVAYLACVAFFRSQLSERMGHVPVVPLLLILVGLPVVAAAGGWLFAGREPAAIAHQPIE